MSGQFIPWNSITESVVEIQPRTCVHYNPYQCLYKRLFTASVGANILRLDHQCVQFVAQPERPLLCKYYDSLMCTFKPRFGQAQPLDFLKVGLEHFGWLSECYAFDDNGRVVGAMPLPDIRGHIAARWRESVAAGAIH